MRLFPEKYRVPACIGLLLAAGVVATGGAWLMARDAVHRDIAGQALPLTGDMLHSEIRSRIARPALLASAMAGNSFVRDWMAAGEGDTDAIVRYLAGIQSDYDAAAAFVVSEHSRHHYTSQGLTRALQESDAGDSWYFRARDMKQPYAVEIETGRTGHDAMTVFVHHRMVDQDGNFLGVAGVGLRADGLGTLIDRLEKHPGRHIYLVDGQRKVALAGSADTTAGRLLDQMLGMSKMARRLPHGGDQPLPLEYRRDDARILVNARFIPELGWHLLVEQDAAVEVQPVRNAFVLVLATGAGLSLLALVLTLWAAGRHRQRLEQMAGTDLLTGLLNRQAFEIVFRQAMLEADRDARPLSCILFDVDFLRQVNDVYGYPAGDEVLRVVARIARTILRESDMITRWGGEEFVVLLKECTLEQAVAVAEKLRHEIDQHDFSAIVAERHVTISLGVAQHDIGENAFLFLRRADEALYKAKANGRNRLQVAVSSTMEGSAAGVA